MALSSDLASLFSRGYAEARDRFLTGASARQARMHALPLPDRGANGEALTIDIAWFGNPAPQRLLLHLCGVHGVEAYAGSAVQLALLNDLPDIPADGAIALVHAVNPYGMSWRRRTNAGNVDLNRNALTTGEAWRGAHPLYPRLDPWLNPPSPPAADAFLARAAWLALRHGPRNMKQAIAEGQYDYPCGLFYGGKALAPELAALFGWLRTLPHIPRVMVIDYHTGLGPRTADTLIREATAAHTPTPALERALEHPLCDPTASDSTVYTVRGGLGAALPAILPQAQLDYLLQEIGTLPALQVLHALREENRWFHHERDATKHPARARLFEALCPADPAWRAAAVTLGVGLAHRATAYLFGENP